jgi:hypothetical protein
LITFTVIVSYFLTTEHEWRKPRTFFRQDFKLRNNGRSITSTSSSTIRKTSSNTNDEAGMTINDEQIRDDLVDFAIVAFPKCSTTYLEFNLLNIPSHINFGKHGEICPRNDDDAHKLASLYQKDELINDGKKRKNAFKCPNVLYSPSVLYTLQKYFPNTKLIISVRHPVLWFQSFYNFRIRGGYKLPPASKLVGNCGRDDEKSALKNDPKEQHIPYNDSPDVCTDHSRFHYALSRLGKTTMDSHDEQKLLKYRNEFQIYGNEGNSSSTSFSKVKVFLMEVGQLDVDNMAEEESFISELEKFIGLELDENNDVMSSWNHVLPHLRTHPETHTEDVNGLINICSNEYEMIRSELVQIGHEAAEWIENFFLKSPDVVVPNRASFITLLQTWKIDPCHTDIV